MQVYIDESGSSDGKVFVQAALVLYDNRSKSAISKIVSQTILDLKDHLERKVPKKFQKLPQGRIIELKGFGNRGEKDYIPGLNDYHDIRDQFFRQLVKEANFSLHILYIDFDESKPPTRRRNSA